MQYILTEQEYKELKESSPDQLLRDTNTQLKQKLDACESKLEQGAFDNVKLESPFIVTNEHLCIRGSADFMILYNALAGSTLNNSDEAIFNYLTNLAQMLNYEPQFDAQKDLKAYRVSLQKKKLYNKVMKDGKIYLEFPNTTGD